jgi:hypothetical protein
MKNPLKNRGALDRFFLLDTVRHIRPGFFTANGPDFGKPSSADI